MPSDVTPAGAAWASGDFSSLDHLAARFDEAAAFVHSQASIVADGLGVDWTGTAARLFHRNLGIRADQMTLCGRALTAMAEAARQEAATARRVETWLVSGFTHQVPVA